MHTLLDNLVTLSNLEAKVEEGKWQDGDKCYNCSLLFPHRRGPRWITLGSGYSPEQAVNRATVCFAQRYPKGI